MARSVQSFSADTLADLETAVNAALAALTNPTLTGFDISMWVDARRLNTDLKAILSSTSGGAALGTPFLLKTFQADTMADLNTAVQAFLTGNAAAFISGTRLLYADPDRREPMCIAWLIYNVTGGASANFALL